MKLERLEIFADQSDIGEVLRGAKRGNMVLKRGHWSLSPADVVVLHLGEISLFYGAKLISFCYESESFVFALNQGGIKCGNRGTGFLDSKGSHR